jgi:excisionase family DNA binding protein
MAGRPQNARDVPASSSSIMTLVEVAEFLRVNPSTLYRLLKKSRIPCFRVGSDYRFNRASVEEWIRSKEEESAGPDSNSPGRGRKPRPQ